MYNSAAKKVDKESKSDDETAKSQVVSKGYLNRKDYFYSRFKKVVSLLLSYFIQIVIIS